MTPLEAAFQSGWYAETWGGPFGSFMEGSLHHSGPGGLPGGGLGAKLQNDTTARQYLTLLSSALGMAQCGPEPLGARPGRGGLVVFSSEKLTSPGTPLWSWAGGR